MCLRSWCAVKRLLSSLTSHSWSRWTLPSADSLLSSRTSCRNTTERAVHSYTSLGLPSASRKISLVFPILRLVFILKVSDITDSHHWGVHLQVRCLQEHTPPREAVSEGSNARTSVLWSRGADVLLGVVGQHQAQLQSRDQMGTPQPRRGVEAHCTRP